MGMKKQIISTIVVFIFCFVAANIICGFYVRDVGGSMRSGGASRWVYQPKHIIVQKNEGYVINLVDENGYINRSANLSKQGYALIFGNSQTHGANVNPDEKYTAILSDLLGQNVEKAISFF